MTKGLRIGKFEIFWLNGGFFELDAGTMFGVVPKVLWQKKYPAGPDNVITLTNSLMLIKSPDGNVVIETGLGNKLTEKQKRIFSVTKEWDVPAELFRIGLSRSDISHVILTHCDFDHAGGIIMDDHSGKPELTFPAAVHHIQKLEWEDVLEPNLRSESSYWPVNFSLLTSSPQLHLVDGSADILPGIRVTLSGGHTRGHQVVFLESQGESALHLGDLLPNHAHLNPLWVTPFDNFPLDSVAQKKILIELGVAKNAWVLFYHDPFMYACKLDKEGEIQRQWPDPA